jgi:NAD(P)-dependent dehydrogenase (short-subunit alcohol dehydrogenase family)
MKTVLITGCSSGFGLETARYFLDRGWSVAATMRTPREDVLPRSEHLRVIPLDVTNQDSIEQAVDAAGPIDVLVNNAGIGWLNALEGTPMEITRQTFETNTFGTMAMTQAVLPQFRERRSGAIVNVTSSVTLKPLPLLSAYTGSKAAVNAFSEVLALELEPFAVRVRVVLPGRAPETSFGRNAMARSEDEIPEAYLGLAQRVFASWQQETGRITHATDVAQAIWRAATDPACPMRLAAGADAAALIPS